MSRPGGPHGAASAAWRRGARHGGEGCSRAGCSRQPRLSALPRPSGAARRRPSRVRGRRSPPSLIPHIVAGLTALSSGAAVLVSRKGTGWHMRAGATYFWAIALLAATAAALTAVRGARDLPVLGLGLLALALAAAGRHARRQPGARPWRAWPGHGPHIRDHDQLLHRDVDRVPDRQRPVPATDQPAAHGRCPAAAIGHRRAARRLVTAPPSQARASGTARATPQRQRPGAMDTDEHQPAKG